MASLLARHWSVVQRSAWRSWSRLQSYSTAGGVNKGILDVSKKKETSVEEVKPEDLVCVHVLLIIRALMYMESRLGLRIRVHNNSIEDWVLSEGQYANAVRHNVYTYV